MRAFCPIDSSHQHFRTLVRENHEWLVYEDGELIEHIKFFDVEEGPRSDNTWFCYECGAKAEMEDAEPPDEA